MMAAWALSTKNLQASSRCLWTWVSTMKLVTRRLLLTECTIWREDAFFSGSGHFNSIWQLLLFQDNPVTVSCYRQEWGWGYQRPRFGGLLKLGGDVVMLAPGARAQMSFRGRNLRSCYFRSLWDPNGVGVMQERGRKRKRRGKKMSSVDTKAIG